MSLGNALLTGRATTREQFWSDIRSWPRDAPGFIFLARAVQQLGRIRQPDWSDAAPATELIWPLSEPLTIHTPKNDIERAVAALRACDNSYRERNGGIGMGLLSYPPQPPDFPTRAEWQVAAEIIKSKSEASFAKYYPFMHVANELQDAFLEGRLTTATRAFVGGEMRAKDWSFWNSENAWVRFETCRVDPADEFSVLTFGGNGLWLYVEEAAFEAYCKDAKPEASAKTAVPDMEAVRVARPRGRKPKHMWDDIFGEALRRFQFEGDPSSDRQFARELAAWAAERFEDAPDDSSIREKLPKWFGPLRREQR